MAFRLWQAVFQRKRHKISRARAIALIERAQERLRSDLLLDGKNPQVVDRLTAHLVVDEPPASFAKTAKALGVSDGVVEAAVHRLRHRFRMLLFEEADRDGVLGGSDRR